MLLDAYGSYFWYPTWSEEFNFDRINVNYGEENMTILDFTWPEVQGNANGVIFYGTMLTQDLSNLFGHMDLLSFGWEE